MFKDLSINMGKKFIKIPMILCIIISVVFILCNANNSVSNTVKFNNTVIEIDPKINETALFLAGKEIPSQSDLHKYSKTKEYNTYSKQIDANWDKLQRLNEKKISIWRQKNLPKDYTKSIFYPFSGPDILNAVIFFPDGDEYIMFGLESPGEIPGPHKISNDKLHFGLNKLWEALDTILNVNFFKTIEMVNEISTNAFDSVISVCMFFLARTNYDVLDVKKIWIDENGDAVSVKPQNKSKIIIPGCEILFRKGNGTSVKRLAYFQIDVSNPSLNVRKNYIDFITKKGRFTTIIKSASYLMHREVEFKRIRDVILSQSDYLLQDDSGIPLKYFSPKEWKLSYYGSYTKPIELFSNRYQKDLFEAMKKNSTGQLDFSYGYNFKEHNPNLLFAERTK
ncbi:MAG: hypothetical protein V1874_03015 [Spirochaetota bacterium]